MPHIHIDSRDRAAGTPTDFNVSLKNVFQSRTNYNSVAVKSVEVPYTWYSIRENLNSTFTWVFSNLNSKIIDIPIGNPSSAQIIASILAQININSAGDTYTAVVSTTNAKLTFNNTNVPARTFSLLFDQDPNTKEILGFTEDFYAGETSYQSENVIDVSPEKFLLLKSSISLKTSYDWDSFSKSNAQTIMKIPINAGFFSNIIYEPPITYLRECELISNTVEFRLTHDNGETVNLNGRNFSFTLIYN